MPLVYNSNLSQYIPELQIYIGDIDGTQFSQVTLLTALVNGVKYLSRRFNNRYLIYGSGILQSIDGSNYIVNVPEGQCTIPNTVQENDVFRNCYFAFDSIAPPIIEQQDLPAILLAASYLLRRAQITSSVTGLSWSTPDLSYSNIQTSKTLQDLMKLDLDGINLFFKFKLGRIQMGRLKIAIEPFYTPIQDQLNFYTRQAQMYKYNQ